MITDYASLQAAIADYLGRSDLTTQIQTFIAQAEGAIYRQMHIAAREKPLALTIASNGTAPVPSDYMALRECYLIDSNGAPYQPLERTTPFWVHQRFNSQNSQGQPYYIAREGQNFIFAPTQAGSASVGGIYYARLPGLSAINTTNWLTASNPDLIMAGAMLEAGTYLGDTAAVQYWQQRFDATIAAVAELDMRECQSGSPPVMRRG